MKKQKILAVSVGRSDYDRYFPILEELNQTKKIKLYLYLTKSHLDPVFGKTIKFIDKKFHCLKNNYSLYKNKDFVSCFSIDLNYLNLKIKKIKPDKIIVLGDRFEMLIGPIAAMPYNIPVIHLYGGAVTLGAIDELIRHSITKMSHFHFTLLPIYKKRLIQLGEEKWRIEVAGMHELNLMKRNFYLSKKYLGNIFNFDFEKPYLLFTFHPVTLELQAINYQLKSILKAIKVSKLNVVTTFPNADPGHEKVIKFINKNFKGNKKYLIIKNCGKINYTSILKHASLILGNSSSGIVEAATLKIPSVNVGSRQEGKFKPKNVIDTSYKSVEIIKAMSIAKSKKFQKQLLSMTNPYESKISLKKLANIIINLKNNEKLLKKKFIDTK